MGALLDEHEDRQRGQHSGDRGQPKDNAETMQSAAAGGRQAYNRQSCQWTRNRACGVGGLVEAERTAARRGRNESVSSAS